MLHVISGGKRISRVSGLRRQHDIIFSSCVRYYNKVFIYVSKRKFFDEHGLAATLFP